MTNSNKVTCPRCRGAGARLDKMGAWEQCPDCKGHGELTRKQWWKLVKQERKQYAR